MIIDSQERLVEWFAQVKRDFPWRSERSAYTVLVSEIMLQQTKASVVLPFFNAWMGRFPDFNTLANASEEDVIKAWEGLGYYSRARNLRMIAKRVVEDFHGTFPKDIESILSFKGIGPYTSAAISHFAFGKRALGADGNIKKVLARYYGYKEPISNEKPILELVDRFLPENESAECFEGLIELGATVCKKKPLCNRCPLSDGCFAYSEGLADILPVVKKRAKIEKIFRLTLIIESERGVLIQKESGNLMKGLYALPYVEIDHNYDATMTVDLLRKHFTCTFTDIEQAGTVSHTFTRYKALLTAVRCKITASSSLASVA